MRVRYELLASVAELLPLDRELKASYVLDKVAASQVTELLPLDRELKAYKPATSSSPRKVTGYIHGIRIGVHTQLRSHTMLKITL